MIYQICLASLSFNILLILFASSYKDILEKEKKASDVAFLFVTLYSTTLNIFAKYLKFVLFFSNQTSVCRKWLSQEKNTDAQIVMRSEKTDEQKLMSKKS